MPLETVADPIGFAGDGANMYRYCANNPVNWNDPYGLKDWGKIAWGSLGLVGATVELGLFAASEVGTAGASTTVAGFVIFGIASQYSVSAAYFAEGWTDGDGAKNLPSTPVGALAKIGGPTGDKIGKVADGLIGIGTTGYGVFGAKNAFESAVNAYDIGRAIVDTGSGLVESDPGRSWSSTDEGGIHVFGTEPTFTTSYWAAAFPGSLLGRFAPSSPYRGWYQFRTYNPVTGGWDRHSSVSHDTGPGFDGNLASPLYQQQARNP